MDEIETEVPCPECGHEGPHTIIDESALECVSCYTSIDITGGSDA